MNTGFQFGASNPTGGFGTGSPAFSGFGTSTSGTSGGTMFTVTSQPAASTGSIFGTPAVTPATGAGLGLIGGTTSTPAGGLFSGFGASTASTGIGGFPSLSTSTAAVKPAFTAFGLGGTSLAQPAPAATGGMFGTNTGLGLSTSTTGFSSSGLGSTGFTGFGALPLAATTTTPSMFGLGGPLAGAGTLVVTTTATTGLGGVDLSNVATGAKGGSGGSGKPDSKAVKETQLPSEIFILTDSFKKYVKEQQVVKEEIRRISSQQLSKVQEDIVTLKQLIVVTSSALQRSAAQVTKLKQETAIELKNAEMAHHVKGTPAGLHYDYSAPMEYFQLLVNQFENRMQLYRQQIEQMEKHVSALVRPSVLTPKEVTVVIRRLHDTFVALAAQMQGYHENIMAIREQYVQFRRQVYGDTGPLLDSSWRNSPRTATPVPKVPVTVGPNPFTGSTNATAAAMSSALNRTQQQGAPPILGLTSGQGFGSSLGGGVGMQSSLIGGLNYSSIGIKPLGQDTTLGGPTSPSKTFQLQKPPLSNKRGKR